MFVFMRLGFLNRLTSLFITFLNLDAILALKRTERYYCNFVILHDKLSINAEILRQN